ncbi:MAG TPA: glycoside hydrolase family 32 protein [Candidatus Eisenbergiella merdipullorum]|uniref:Glycoside hydrolase family 32 protein n=1 Tax=Candidatus Eisenbergiella merdipullorum TaxID=2838553 RepID=A0A9D2L077_9FIRM|nr:glycoside hydrolase family 32 protein [Candidatus Eisenbergiella merdipullorum]
MKKYILLNKKYLLIPICAEKETETVSFSLQEGKVFEFKIPVSRENGFYSFHYFAPLNVEKYRGKKMLVEGDVPESFLDAISLSEGIPSVCQSHPLIHFTADTGWINDPNGLIYQNGIYHLFYQKNPFDTRWENMCWGHAVSTDLLHWERKETALYPDGDGTVFSGSGIVNEKGLLGVERGAQIFFYTCAGSKSEWSRGKTFTQKIAVSTDGGETLKRMEGFAVRQLAEENRDPKVYWHEESGAYYMVLYLRENDFVILRSKDLKYWKRSQTLTLKKAWECPDLRKIPVEGGGEKWVFFSADGYYFTGDFNGYEFKPDGECRKAWKTDVPYAAQTFWGTKDVIWLPWLRTKNRNKLYTGTMGLPRKLTLVKKEEGYLLRQLPVDSFSQARSMVHSSHGEGKVFCMSQKDGALEICIHMEKPSDFSINLYGTPITYVSSCGKLGAGAEVCDIGKNLNDFSVLADGELLEVSAENGLNLAVAELLDDRKKGNVTVEVSGKARVEIYRID